MEKDNKNESVIKGDLSCKQCKCYFLLEILTNKEDCLLTKYCKCEKISIPIDTKNLIKEIANIDDEFYLFKVIRTNFYKYIYNLFSFCSKKRRKDYPYLVDLPYFFCTCHNSEILSGFCSLCNIPVCRLCVEESHENHEINYTKNLRVTDDILNKYENNLFTAFSKFHELIKLKYGKKYKDIHLSNIYDEENEINFKDIRDNQIFILLRLLKTILDDYNKNKKWGYLNYQLTSNLLNHLNMEIIRLPDNSNSCKRYKGIENIGNNRDNNESDIQETVNENINIYLKIDSDAQIQKTKKFLIYREKLFEYSYSLSGEKLIRLQNNDFALNYFNCYEILLFKNYKQYSKIETHSKVKDFIRLKNGNLCILFSDEIIIYNIKKILFYEVKEIKLYFKYNYKIKNGSGNNFFHLSSDNFNNYLVFYSYPNYEEEKVLLYKQTDLFGDCIYLNKTIVAVFLLKDIYKVFFYHANYKVLESIEIKLSTFPEKVKCFKIDKTKLLLVDAFKLIVVNAKTKQIVTHINCLYNVSSFYKINNFYLAGHESGVITQINKAGKILNNFKIRNDYNKKQTENFYSFIDMKTNRICIFSDLSGFGLYKYTYI